MKRDRSFSDAHATASEIEQQIMKELPLIGKVTVHMEEYEASEHELENVTGTEVQLARCITEEVEKNSDIFACKRSDPAAGRVRSLHAKISLFFSTSSVMQRAS